MDEPHYQKLHWLRRVALCLSLALLTVLAGCDRTDFSPHFSQNAFDALRQGDDIRILYATLGRPLRATAIALPGETHMLGGAVAIANDMDTVLAESRSPTRFVVLEYGLPHRGSEDYRRRDVHLRNGKIIHVLQEYYTESVFFDF